MGHRPTPIIAQNGSNEHAGSHNIDYIKNIEDPLALVQMEIVRAAFRGGLAERESGAKVVVQGEFENADPEVVEVFRTAEQLTGWKDKLNQNQEILKREIV